MSSSRLAELLRGKRLLIFDLDGTIVDSSPLHARAFNEAFAGDGIAVDYATVAGLTTEAAVDRIAAGAGLTLDMDRRAMLAGDKRARARRLIARELAAFPGSLEFIAAAAGTYPMALCTSGSRATVAIALERVGLAGVFDPVVTADDVAEGKPEPEGFLKALNHHRLRPQDALVIEDAPSGLAAAAAAGIAAIRVVPSAEGVEGAADWAMLNAALRQVGR